MSSKKHVHKYHKLQDGLWHCALSDCTHFMPHNVAYNMRGKNSLCWDCNEKFPLDEEAMENDEPICYKCRIGIGETDLKDLNKMIEKQGEKAAGRK